MIKTSNRKVAAVDVDLTVVDMVTSWVDHMNRITGANFEIKEGTMYPYNLTEIYKHYLVSDYDKDLLFKWWNKEDLYDSAVPIDGSVEALKSVNDAGYDIVFVSHCEGNHARSKYYFLRRYFPFMAGFMATREKGFVRADIAFDDRNEYLCQYPDYVTKYLKVTPFKQTQHVSTIPFDNWEDIKTYAEEGVL